MDEERSLEEWHRKRAELAAQEALLDAKTYAIPKEGLEHSDSYDEKGKFISPHKLSGLPVRRLSKAEASELSQRVQPGFIEGSVRTRKTGVKVTVTRNGISFTYKDVVEESIGSRTSAFEVHRWWAIRDEEDKIVPMSKVMPEEHTIPEEVGGPYDMVLFDPKPRGGHGYTISRHGKIPGDDPAFGPKRPSRTRENPPRLPNVGQSLKDVMCECHHIYDSHDLIPESKICWEPGCECTEFSRKV